jgi:acyl carrier protein
MDVVEVGRGADRAAISHQVLGILEQMTSDWDLDLAGGITPRSQLVADLGFESLDIVQLIVAIQEAWHRRDLPFEQLLMTEGRYVDDLTVTGVVDFLALHVGSAGPGSST